MLTKEKDILSVREQSRIAEEVLHERLHRLLPALMEETGTELWLVLCREYNEDPVFKTLVPPSVKNASRTSCFLFSLRGGEFHALSLSRPNPRLAPYYEQAYDPHKEDQFAAIARAVAACAPKKVAVNICGDCAQADGLSKFEWDRLREALPGVEFVTDGALAVRWLETRTGRELALYPAVYRISMEVLREAYTPEVITPGVTTTTDVEWFIRQRISDMGLDDWFAPDVDLQRAGGTDQRMCDTVILEGDLLHTDMGLTYLCGLHTDTQRLGYVLRRTQGEKEIPAGLLAGFARGNRFQDIVRENFITGRTGNEIFAASLAQARKEGLRPQLYSHPVGVYGHGAGPTIGLYDNQGFVPGHGEYVLHPDTCFALELNVCETVPEWGGQDVCFMLEETIACTGDGRTNFLDDGRKKIAVIG